MIIVILEVSCHEQKCWSLEKSEAKSVGFVLYSRDHWCHYTISKQSTDLFEDVLRWTSVSDKRSLPTFKLNIH